jgi:metal-responsive CopG/Arc/MetJ family transcriptional regulator
MPVKRINITIPEELSKKLSNISNKSKFIAEAVEEKLNQMEKEKLDKVLAEGYKATKMEDKEINNDWENITLERWIK